MSSTARGPVQAAALADTAHHDEHEPLTGGKRSPASSPLSFKIALVVIAILTALTITFAVLFVTGTGRRKAAQSPAETEDDPFSKMEEFPLRTPDRAWDISAPNQREFHLNVTEGTWMSLDVSPDGKTLAFDLLGDIYELDLASPGAPGAEQLARPLLSGVPFDTQPRYHPTDPDVLLFTSDRSGCDNLWTYNRRSGAFHAVSDYRYRFVSHGMWNERGDRVLGVKWHFTTRSIPAGSVYEFPVPMTDGQGSPVRKRSHPADQIGPEEPVYHCSSPGASAGACVSDAFYYAMDSADSPRQWTYSKDPHKGIYRIFRQSLEDLRAAPVLVASGVGGASRPLLNPNGTELAYVKRYKFQTSLVVMTLATGNERLVFKGLDPDQQQVSAPSGTYPRFAWAPDGRSVYAFAGGRFVQIDTLNGGVLQTFHFRAVNTIRMGETARANAPVFGPGAAPATPGATATPTQVPGFTSKVTRWASVTSDRSTVAFQALGRAYTRAFSTTERPAEQRMSDAPDDLEFSPTIAPDGKHVAYVVWTDAGLASVVVKTTRAEQALTLPLGRGRYADLAFSLFTSTVSGNAIATTLSLAYVRLGGDHLTGSYDSHDAGVYTIDFAVDEANGWLLTPSAAGAVKRLDGAGRPSWTAGGDLLVDQGSSAVLVPIAKGSAASSASSSTSSSSDDDDADLTSPRVVAVSPFSRETVVSPTLTHVAFLEFHQIGLLRLRKPISLTQKTAPLATARLVENQNASFVDGYLRLARHGGERLAFSPDGKHVRWLLGAEMFEVALASVDACAQPTDGRFQACVADATRTVDLSVDFADPRTTEECLAVVNATVLTFQDGGVGAGGRIEQASVVVRGNRVVAVGPSASLPDADACAKVVQADGGYVVPGFIDVHAHFSPTPRHSPRADWQYLLNLAFGVTTLHNPSIDTVTGFAESELVRAGRKAGPRLFLTGTILYGAEGGYRCEINSVLDAQEALMRLKAYGAFSVKSYNQPCRSSRQMVLAAARALNVSVVPEGGMAFSWNTNQIIDGHATIEHNIPVSPLYDDMLSLFVASGTAYTPTLVVSYGGIMGERFFYDRTNVWENEKLARLHPNEPLWRDSIIRLAAPDADYSHMRAARDAANFARRGGNLELGAHGQRQGVGYHWEMAILKEHGGLSTLDVLRAATSHGARSVGLHQVGELVVGNAADFLVYPPGVELLDETPGKFFENLQTLLLTVADGVVYDSKTMARQWPGTPQAPPRPPQVDLVDVSGT